jgi:phage shock protein C
MNQDRSLYRSSKDKMIGGVAGGLGEWMNIDPTLIRIALILLTLVFGGGIITYIILWIVLPADDPSLIIENNPNTMEENKTNESGHKTQYPQHNPKFKKKDDGSLIGGLVLISLGLIFLVIRYFPRIDFGDLWPVILIVIGIVLLRNAFISRKQ